MVRLHLRELRRLIREATEQDVAAIATRALTDGDHESFLVLQDALEQEGDESFRNGTLPDRLRTLHRIVPVMVAMDGNDFVVSLPNFKFSISDGGDQAFLTLQQGFIGVSTDPKKDSPGFEDGALPGIIRIASIVPEATMMNELIDIIAGDGEPPNVFSNDSINVYDDGTFWFASMGQTFLGFNSDEGNNWAAANDYLHSIVDEPVARIHEFCRFVMGGSR